MLENLHRWYIMIKRIVDFLRKSWYNAKIYKKTVFGTEDGIEHDMLLERGNCDMYAAKEIARYVIQYCQEKNYTISNLKLQKILYFLQAEFLVDTGMPCFREKIEAWDFGPVVPDVYHVYKIYGSASIPSDKSNTPQIPYRDRVRIDSIVDECAKYAASTLVEITHSQTPWKQAYSQGRNTEITNDCIMEFFQEG